MESKLIAWAAVAALALALALTPRPAFAAETYAAWSGYTPETIRGGAELLACESCSAEASDTDGNGRVDRVSVVVTPSRGAAGYFTFGAGTGRDLEPGLFTRATLDETPGRPLLRFTAFDVCSSREAAAFEILDAKFDTTGETPRVVSFLARLEVKCALEPFPFKAVVSYEAPELPEIVSAEFAAASRTVRVYGPRVETASSLLVDGSAVAFKVDAGGGLVAKRQRLGAGTHEVQVGGPDGYVSPPYAVVVGDDPPFAKGSFRAKSDPGEFVGRGETYRSGKAPIGFRAQIGFDSGLPETLGFGYTKGTTGIGIEFSTAKTGAPFAEGFYPNAMRIPFEEAGHPGMDASSGGRGCNMVAGQFTVTDYGVDTLHGLPRVRWAAVDFEHFCEGGPLGLRGSVRYVAPDPVVIIGAGYSAGERTLRVRATGLEPDVDLYVDGQRLGPVRLDGDTLVLGNVDLGPGRHLVAVYVGTSTRFEYSQPWVFTL